MCDKLVFDLSQENEGQANVFVRKDWLNILDNMNGNYQANQSIIDTSQLTNSNKWMSYREGYLTIPMIGALWANEKAVAITAAKFSDFSMGLKNWMGQIIHSITIEYNGTTIIQQTPFINMWNSFKLLTSFSYQDILSQGSTIGFYPDDATAWVYNDTATGADGDGICNNKMLVAVSSTSSILINSGSSQNSGFAERLKNIAFDPSALKGIANSSAITVVGKTSSEIFKQVWRSVVERTAATAGSVGYVKYSMLGVIQLRHLCDFFDKLPLLKGAFMKITLNLNNTSGTITTAAGPIVSAYTNNTPVGGVCPVLVASGSGSNPNSDLYTQILASAGDLTLGYALSVGSKILGVADATINALTGSVGNNVYLNIPAYTFNPTFEEAYLSASPKVVKYSDVYQYQLTNIQGGENFNRLITNGIANIKSVLVIPYYSYKNVNLTTGAETNAYNEWNSPFDPAGAGCTAPCVVLTNFQVQVSGQNAIYNTQRYEYEEFVNQLYGENAVNGGLTDGLTSGLIDYLGWQNSYHYYYVNVERMLPVEKSVPKSIQIQGQNLTGRTLNCMVFVEYENEMRFDLITGARV